MRSIPADCGLGMYFKHISGGCPHACMHQHAARQTDPLPQAALNKTAHSHNSANAKGEKQKNTQASAGRSIDGSISKLGLDGCRISGSS